MGKILDALAMGKINVATYELVDGSELSKASDNVETFKREFTELLSEEQKKGFDMYMSVSNIYNELEAADRFCYGYRIGVMTMAEVFTEQDKIIEDDSFEY